MAEQRLIDAYLKGEIPKIKTHFAEIIVSGENEKPYYSIVFIDPQTGEYEVCFGSFSLANVRKWLSEEFEIVEAPPVDAVPVVRCKDCKQWCRNVGFTDSPNGHCFYHDIDTNGCDFCSYGERKDNEKE